MGHRKFFQWDCKHETANQVVSRELCSGSPGARWRGKVNAAMNSGDYSQSGAIVSR